MTNTKCESCSHYVYDEESLTAYCEIDLDEDDYGRLSEFEQAMEELD
jgi:hypothetical protein